MNSKTHMYVGAAVSLAILRPVGVGNSLIGITGGLLGAWICDIDLNTKSDIGDYFAGAKLLVVLCVIAALDFSSGSESSSTSFCIAASSAPSAPSCSLPSACSGQNGTC
ncbi:MAG: metal-dependent hydrolase [Atopobiaceae bacterium]|nr:metal-dependent hydrolase [Atopobiaceae bacterium]